MALNAKYSLKLGYVWNLFRQKIRRQVIFTLTRIVFTFVGNKSGPTPPHAAQSWSRESSVILKVWTLHYVVRLDIINNGNYMKYEVVIWSRYEKI